MDYDTNVDILLKYDALIRGTFKIETNNLSENEFGLLANQAIWYIREFNQANYK